MMRYLDGSRTFGKVHNVFVVADEIVNKERMAERAKIRTRKPRIVPMPELHFSELIEGPLHMGKEVEEAWDKRKKAEKIQTQAECELKLKLALLKKARWQKKREELNISKKKDYHRAILIDTKLSKIEEEIRIFKEASGIDPEKEPKDSIIGKLYSRIKPVVKKIVKKVKKFFKKYTEEIIGVSMAVASTVGPILFKYFTKARA